jgi:hypothetical protein
MDLAELNTVLRAFRITLPWADHVEDTRQYLRRMTTLRQGTNAFNDEMDRMLDLSSTAGARRAAKSAQRTASWMYAAGPNVATQKFIWINEDDEHLCDVCDDAAGTGGTLAEIADSEWGLPGTSCLGGNDCRCELMPVSF